jgi:hypothetical protein
MLINEFEMDPSWRQEDKDVFVSYYNDIWKNNEYNRFGIRVETNDIVVDCGANLGFFSTYAISLGASEIIAFEQNPTIYRYLVKNTKNKNITCINGTVSGETKDFNLKKIIEVFDLKKIDFLKIDIEGDEFSFISNAANEDLNKVNKIVIEGHVYQLCIETFNSPDPRLLIDGKNKGKEFKKTMDLLIKLSKNGFKINIDQPHPNTCCYMIYANK